MRRLFDPDSPLMRLLSQLAELSILSVLWVLCSLPLITAGAAAAGLYRGVFSLLREDGQKPWRLFFREFRESFLPATGLWLIFLGVLGLTALNLWFCRSSDFFGEVFLLGLTPLVLLLWLICASYAFPLTAQFSNTVGGTLRNALILGITHPLRTLAILFLNLLPLLTLLISEEFFLRSLVFWLLLGVGILSFADALLLRGVFRKLMPPEE